ncbi:MAG TPA: hypothetical protein ENJ37_09260 [Deltaproteobacteria bacterium]|nr:hypothetical protein [Deltaproteobacteria bacterium]
MKVLVVTAAALLLCPGAFGADKRGFGSLHMHPTGVRVPQWMEVPDELPLGGGRRLVCGSCHGIERIEEMSVEEVEKNAPTFLLGGPYERLSDFCFKCHERKDYRRNNIHRMLDRSGRPVKQTCLYCHEEALDPRRFERGGDLRLRLPIEDLCTGCHLKTPHLNAWNHLVKPSEEMAGRMRRSEKEKKLLLPLDGEGRIACVTCHNPHEPGVLDRESPAAAQAAEVDVAKGIVYAVSPWSAVVRADKEERVARLAEESGLSGYLLPPYRKVEKEVLLRLRARDGSLCLACHDFSFERERGNDP